MFDGLRRRNPSFFSFVYQPRIRLHSGQLVIPDFEIRYDLGFQKDARLIECQSRNRSSNDIIHKIRHIKSLSSWNRFILVYEEKEFLASTTRWVVQADGIVAFSFEELERYLSVMEELLTLRKEHSERFIGYQPHLETSA